MRLGGFVIFKDNAGTIGKAVRSLHQVCDKVVAVDTGSTDGSAGLIDSLGVRRLVVPWQGFGAARRAAVSELTDCDFIFFLDSDEFLEGDAVHAVLVWKRSNPTLPFFSLARRDWYFSNDVPKFIFRKEWRKRLIRRDAAAWDAKMVVHEALPQAPTVRLTARIEHRFADETSLRSTKDRTYALLWAIMHCDSGTRIKNPLAQWISHLIRNALVKGAAFRGHRLGVILSIQAARYHSIKFKFLARVRQGEFPELVELYRQEDYSRLFLAVSSVEKGKR